MAPTESCVSVKEGAPAAYNVTVGKTLSVTLSDLFTDSNTEHTMTYALVGDVAGAAIADGKLTYTSDTVSEDAVSISVKATCSDSKEATATLSVTVSAECTLSVKEDAVKTYAATVGKELTVDLSTIFADTNSCHTLTCSIVTEETSATIEDTTLKFTPAAVGETKLTVKAACADGKEITAELTITASAAVPTRKTDYAAETTATVKTGTAYLLSDLQKGKVFDGVEGQEALTYENYYYERSADNGQTWGARTVFTKALFGGTTIQITEKAAGVYMYRFYASHDGVNFSTDTWTLTLNVEDNPRLDFTFYVGKDYNGNYPIIKLYNVTTDEGNNEILGEEITGCFLYSNFTDTAPEGTDTYDTSKGILANNYQTFYAKLTAGRYAYRAFAKNSETDEYNIALGGMTLDLPTESNVDGNAGGGTSIYLRTVNFYSITKKSDGTYFAFAANEYHIELNCPLMSTTAAMGTAYTKENYAYYPAVIYSAGNACLYNVYAYSDIPGYTFALSSNYTCAAGYSVLNKSLNIGTALDLTVTVPQDADFGLYYQWNNFNTTEEQPTTGWANNDDGTKTATYTVSLFTANNMYTWRLSDKTHVTKTGWLTNPSTSGTFNLSFDDDAPTNRASHDRSNLGTVTKTRDEADLLVNYSATGYKVLDGTTRVRAYRLWELINNDSANIMVEPDFHWTVKSGNATVATVDGGNTSDNWADITAGTEDSIITVYYDSADVYKTKFDKETNSYDTDGYGTHGGFYPATNPVRVNALVVAGTGTKHGTADANVAYNKLKDSSTVRPDEWDYNYDTWYFGSTEEDPTLDFTVTSDGTTTVEYAFVATTDAMESTLTNYTAATKTANGYSIPLKGFRSIGNGKGGTVIIKMTDSTGVSYRLVQVAEVTFTFANASNPGENIMPGDRVTITWNGMFRGMNKMSGIFNPTLLYPSYYGGETVYKCTLKQYQILDNASFTLTLPENIDFADDAQTTIFSLTNGYTYGSMYSKANPFTDIYYVTDTGVGTNFNASNVTYYLGHFADAQITVYRKVWYDTDIVVKDENGNVLNDVTITLKNKEGKAFTAEENGRYLLGYSEYTYSLKKNGYICSYGSFSLGSADSTKLQSGIMTVTLTMNTADANAWDGITKTEPQTDENGTYLISTAEELAWFAKTVNSGKRSINGKLTADIELAAHEWTPICTNSSKMYCGTFDGDGHIIKNLYISKGGNIGLFGCADGATIKNFGVTGTINSPTGTNVAGILGFMGNSSPTVIDSCFNAVNITGQERVAGIAVGNGGTVQNCYNVGTITALKYGNAGGITCAVWQVPTAKHCYNLATVSAAKDGFGQISNVESGVGENAYYLDTLSGNGYGTAKTSAELKSDDMITLLGDKFKPDTAGVNNGYPILFWQPLSIGGTDTVYDGSAHGITVDTGYIKNPTVRYRTTADGEYTLTASPTYTDAGTYDVYYQFTADGYNTVSGKETVKIAKAPLTISATADGRKYEQNNKNVNATVTFTRLVNNESLTLGTDYTVTAVMEDAFVGENKTVTVTVTLLNTEKANNYKLDVNTVTTTATISKADQSAPAAPTIATRTKHEIVLNTIPANSDCENNAVEYSIDGKTWQTSPKFENLSTENTYTFYAHYVGSDNYNESPASSADLSTVSRSGIATHVIHVYSGANGTVEPSGTLQVRDGGSKTLTITPDAGYEVADVVINHKSVGAVTEYTLKNVDADISVEVTFVKSGNAVVSATGNTANPATGSVM